MVHDTAPDRCGICGTRGRFPGFRVPEMMFGTREIFDYAQCIQCGCVQLTEIPADLERHYPPDYYAFTPVRPRSSRVRHLRNLRNRAYVRGDGVMGRLLDRIAPSPPEGVLGVFRRLQVPEDARILDVGCGSGKLLHDLAGIGFRSLTGVDPYLEESYGKEGDPVRLLRGDVGAAPGRYDLVMLHHALEHIPDQHRGVRALAERLAPEGRCVIRIPVVPSSAWEEHGTLWVQWDAPRHVYLHTAASISTLASAHGLRVVDSYQDSTDLQFWGSDLYRRDIPLVEGRGTIPRRRRRRELRRARELNEAGRGDQAVFILSRG